MGTNYSERCRQLPGSCLIAAIDDTSLTATRKQNTMDGAEVISLYESIADLTDQMLAAARKEDWALLTKLEADCAHVVDFLKRNELEVVLSEDRRDRKIEILKKILEDDRDIRKLTEPGLQKLSSLIQSTSTERKLANTYGMNQRG